MCWYYNEEEDLKLNTLATPLSGPGEGVDLRLMGGLLRAGADINQRNLAGFTPLHQAARRGAYSTGILYDFSPQMSRVADPVHFRPDPDPEDQNFEIRIWILYLHSTVYQAGTFFSSYFYVDFLAGKNC